MINNTHSIELYSSERCNQFKKVGFTKMYDGYESVLVIDTLSQEINLDEITPKVICEWSDYNAGVGFSKLLLIEPPILSNYDFFYSVFNSNGSEVRHSIDNALAFVSYIHKKNYTSNKFILAQTKDYNIELLFSDLPGDIKVEYQENTRQDSTATVRTSTILSSSFACICEGYIF